MSVELHTMLTSTGKITSLKIISDLLKLTECRVLIDGRDITSLMLQKAPVTVPYEELIK